MNYESILDGLNPAQRAAVTSPASVVQILAPPGSGKTKTLTSRVSYLLRHHGYLPWNTLCLTFTIKSAREMKERIEKLIGHGIGSKLVLGTFHSVCRRYLVSYGHLIGLRKGFGIADSADTQTIIRGIVKRLHCNTDPKVARSRISKSKARSDGFEELRKNSIGKKPSVDQQEFVTIFEEYESHLARSNLLDYDDLLLRCVELLRLHPECVSNVEAVLIDEFQDTNSVQFELMQLFASKNNRITTVGDPDQSIYGWRSADVRNLKKMQRNYPDALVINLEQNYRSSGAILLAALGVIQQDDLRPAKPILPTHCPGTVPVFRKLPKASCEASWIVSEILRCVGLTGNDFLHLSDFAILLRSASLSRQIESCMGKAGMPYRMVGGLRFFDRVEIKILIDYLRVVSQPDHSDAFARIMNVPSRRIGETTVRSLLEEARSKGCTLFDLIRKFAQGDLKLTTKIIKPTEQGLTSLFDIIFATRKKLLCQENPCSPHEILQHVLKRLDFEEYLKRTYEEDHETRWANVEELLAQASDFTFESGASGIEDDEALPKIEGVQQSISSSAEGALDKFLANVALSTELQRDDEGDDENARPEEKVTISTIHAAKGLEWPVVFIPALFKGSIPHSRADDCDEERRLLYVAMTRAQALLYLSSPKLSSSGDETTPSPFLATKEVSDHLVSRGPSLRSNTIRDIAQILGRPQPSEEAITVGLTRVLNIEDDLWPLDGEDDPQSRPSRWDRDASRYDESTYKRRRLLNGEDSFAPSSRPASHENRLLYNSSVEPNMHPTGPMKHTTYATGFVSAREHIPPPETYRQKDNVDTGQPSSKGNQGRTSKQRAIRPSKTGSTQGTLSAFWKQRSGCEEMPSSLCKQGAPTARPSGALSFHATTTKPSVEPLGRWTPESTHPLRPTVDASSTAEPAPSCPPHANGTSATRTPLAWCAPRSISQTTSSRPRAPVDDRATSRHPLLSSSPPRAAASSKGSQPAACSNDKPTANGYGVRAATTFHSTTMGKLRAGASGSQRKTLGVRRSMVGWSARRGGSGPSTARTEDGY